ncbi:MAG: ABC transporter substrate-binding protein [Desulfocapsa sp.]|nr:ABC transporter substrate-binding protein [Desulfocapsa sp.]
MTEELPPYNFALDKQVHGISADILLQLMAKNNIAIDRGDIQLLPWPRAYIMVQNKPGSVLFSTARTPQREELFKWVGPITDLTIGLIALKKNNIQLQSPEDLKTYRIGTIRHGAPEQLILKLGVEEKHLDRIASPESNIKKLQAGRIDLFAFNVPSTRYLMIKLGINPDNYETVYTLRQADLYYAFHNDTDEQLIQALNTTLQELHQPDTSGKSSVERIVDNYLNVSVK